MTQNPNSWNKLTRSESLQHIKTSPTHPAHTAEQRHNNMATAPPCDEINHTWSNSESLSVLIRMKYVVFLCFLFFKILFTLVDIYATHIPAPWKRNNEGPTEQNKTNKRKTLTKHKQQTNNALCFLHHCVFYSSSSPFVHLFLCVHLPEAEAKHPGIWGDQMVL